MVSMASITLGTKTAFIDINYPFAAGVFLGECLTVDLTFFIAPFLISDYFFFV